MNSASETIRSTRRRHHLPQCVGSRGWSVHGSGSERGRGRSNSVPRHPSSLTIRRSMWSIAILAILLAAAWETLRLLKRRQHFLELAEAHASRAFDYGEGRNSMCFKPEFFDDGHLKSDFLRHLDRSSAHWSALERKYRHAASHPWLEVESDPPAPSYPEDRKTPGLMAFLIPPSRRCCLRLQFAVLVAASMSTASESCRRVSPHT